MNRLILKFDMTVDTTRLYFDTSLDDLDLLARSQVRRKLELVQSFCFVKWHRAARTLTVCDYLRETTAKTKPCECGECGSFGHLLLFLPLLFSAWSICISVV